MLDLLRKTFLGATVAVAPFLAATTEAEAVTVVAENQTYVVGYGSEFIGDVHASGGAGSWEVFFNASEDPLNALANASVTNLVAGTFTNLVMQWIAVDTNTILASIGVTPTNVSLATIFTNANPDANPQALRFSWTNSLDGAGFDFDVVAAVPLPAGGLLLIGALGGLAFLRRRKTA